MQHPTLRTRISKLIQKSRKALRLYSSMGRLQTNEASELAEQQVAEWKSVNSELAQELTQAMERSNQRSLVNHVFSLRDRFQNEWRMAEAELHVKQRELTASAESADFIKCSSLSRDLVVLKARMQAAQAVHHELQELVDQSKLSQQPIELSDQEIVDEKGKEVVTPQAKVIPIRGVR